ncbi:MAG: rhomboid family intramembrane serine protease [Halofilum sp. (in: g-proteobacteria)]|nr:rhomboid family intramembrane serine protease [Halofilum sp. (in: g-proteobacteria)]
MSDLERLRAAGAAVTGLVALLWAIHGLAAMGDWALAPLGVRPGTASGLIGVLTAPLVHGSWGHLLGNTLPLLVLGTAMAFGTPRAAAIALPAIWLGSGLAVWLFARPAVHLGASGIAYGMMLFVFTAGVRRRDRRSIALALIVFFLHGGMIWGVLPLAAGVSFEYHLAGALVGLVCALLLGRRDPVPPRPRKYAWEGEPIDREHPAADLFPDDGADGDRREP